MAVLNNNSVIVIINVYINSPNKTNVFLLCVAVLFLHGTKAQHHHLSRCLSSPVRASYTCYKHGQSLSCSKMRLNYPFYYNLPVRDILGE